MTPDPLRANARLRSTCSAKGVSDDKHYFVYLNALLTMRTIANPDADVLALEALAWLADSPADLTRFMTHSGLHPADLRARASDPQLLAGVLDFLLGNDALLQRFCQEQSVDAMTVHRARTALPGGGISGT